jgi:uncharacterized phage protein (TIGR01671 family)
MIFLKMNRELKFRIWDKQYKKWIENSSSLHCFSNWTICPFTGNLVDYVGAFGCDNFTASPAHGYYFEGAEVVREPRYVIQQYTGLKDSKGVEIYEGDIVKHRKQNREVRIGEFWDGADDRTGVFLQDPKIKHRNFGTNKVAFFSSCEIIGNVFENRELIKNK